MPRSYRNIITLGTIIFTTVYRRRTRNTRRDCSKQLISSTVASRIEGRRRYEFMRSRTRRPLRLTPNKGWFIKNVRSTTDFHFHSVQSHRRQHEKISKGIKRRRPRVLPNTRWWHARSRVFYKKTGAQSKIDRLLTRPAFPLSIVFQKRFFESVFFF